MSWASDDLGVESEVSQLGSVFRDLYRYSVEYFKIPDVNPDMDVMMKAIDFLEVGRRDG